MKNQIIMREGHHLENIPNYSRLDDVSSLKVYGKLDFRVLAELKEDITLLSTFDGLESNENLKKTEFKVLLAKKYLKDRNSFYIYGSICYPHDPLNKEELIHPLLYINRDDMIRDEGSYIKRQIYNKNKGMILAYYAYKLAQNISPVRLATFHTNFPGIVEWYKYAAHLPSNFESKILELNDGFIVVLHPPHILEYVGGVYDFNMPKKKKEELLEIEVEKGFEIINLCHEFSKDLFLDYGLLNDFRFISPIDAKILKNYIPEKKIIVLPKPYKQNKFKDFLEEEATKDILKLIFVRPLSIEELTNRLNKLMESIKDPEGFERSCEENLKELEESLKENSARFI